MPLSPSPGRVVRIVLPILLLSAAPASAHPHVFIDYTVTVLFDDRAAQAVRLIIILLFSLANEALPVGIAAVASLSLGMAITVSAVGLASVLGRRALARVLDGVGVRAHRLEQGLALAGALAILSVSGFMMMGAWVRL
jgi:hypothetical protein